MHEALLVVGLLSFAVTGGSPGDVALQAESATLVIDGSALGTLRGARLPEAATRPPDDPTLAAPWLVPETVVGVLELSRPWHDARGEALAVGVYRLRYAIQPPRKEHAGTSPWRDFLVLVPVAAMSPRESPPGVHPLVVPLRRGLEEPGAEGEARAGFTLQVTRRDAPPERRTLVVVIGPPSGDPAL